MPQSLLTYKGGLLWLSVRGSPSLLPPPSYFVDLPGLLNGDFFFFFFLQTQLLLKASLGFILWV